MTLLAVSIFCSILLSIFILSVFPALGLLDKPEKFGYARLPVPYSTGFLFALLFIALSFNLLPTSGHSIVVFALVFFISLVSFIDDYRPLSPLLRLGLQVLAGATLSLAGVVLHSISLPFIGSISFDAYVSTFGNMTVVWLSLIFTCVWIVLVMNTLNWLDGVSGLSSGVSCIGFMILYFLSAKQGFHVVDQSVVMVMSLLLAGIAGVIAVFEFPTPKFLMGDSGTMFFGFMLAVLALYSGGKVATALLILGVPVIDALIVIVKRILRKSSPFRGKDSLHLHDRLLKRGWSKRAILCLMFSCSLTLGVAALYWNTMMKVAVFVAVALILTALSFDIRFVKNPRNGMEE